MTKICKSCKENIHIDASRCPNCQSFQSFLRSPNMAGPLMLFFLLPFLWWSSKTLPTNRVQFEENKELINVRTLSKDTIQGRDRSLLNILVEVDNKTSQKWTDATFEIAYLSSTGELLNLEKRKDYNFIIAPNTNGKSSLKVPLYPEYVNAQIEVKLIDLRQPWN